MRAVKRDRRSLFVQPPQETADLLRRSAATDLSLAAPAMRELAKALELPLKQGIMAGNVLDNIFEPYRLAPGAAPEFPIDILAPGTEKNHVAYAIPSHGYIPERAVEGDYIMVPTYEIGSSIDWALKLARDARWDIVGRAMEVFEGSFVVKMNDDGWHTILAAGANRNVMVYDSAAGTGRLTLKLITLMQQTMRRFAGGNTTSRIRGHMTDMYMSIEAFQDMRTWTLAEVDEVTRREIFTREEGGLSAIYDTNLHDMIEFGQNQKYQNWYLNTLGGTLPAGKVELVVGLDLQRNDSFVMPIRQDLEVFEDPNMHRQRKAGVYGWMELGFSCIDSRRIILGAL